jgi:hypothetical protein
MNDFLEHMGVWLIVDPKREILITAQGDEMRAWFYQQKKNGDLSTTVCPFQTKKFAHLDGGEAIADQVSMRGLIALAKEFLGEIGT